MMKTFTAILWFVRSAARDLVRNTILGLTLKICISLGKLSVPLVGNHLHPSQRCCGTDQKSAQKVDGNFFNSHVNLYYSYVQKVLKYGIIIVVSLLTFQLVQVFKF